MANSTPLPESRKTIVVDVEQFTRTRDALSTTLMSLSSGIDRAVKAYIEHTNAVLAGEANLNVSILTQPFHALGLPFAHYGLQPQQNGGAPLPPTSSTAALQGAPEAVAIPEEGADSKRKRRTYKPRDPNAPKRPLTAYFRYLSEIRPILADELAKDPNASHKPGDLSREATERWNSMPQEDRQPYHEAYREALKVYNQELESYKANGDHVPELPVQSRLASKPIAPPDDVPQDDDDSDDSDEEENEPAPPPPKKSLSPEVAKKTPKSALKKDKKVAADAVATPQFNSINPPSHVTASAASKKRKGDVEAEPESSKKKRGRPNKADKAAQSSQTEPSTEEVTASKKKNKKKKTTSEA